MNSRSRNAIYITTLMKCTTMSTILLFRSLVWCYKIMTQENLSIGVCQENLYCDVNSKPVEYRLIS